MQQMQRSGCADTCIQSDTAGCPVCDPECNSGSKFVVVLSFIVVAVYKTVFTACICTGMHEYYNAYALRCTTMHMYYRCKQQM